MDEMTGIIDIDVGDNRTVSETGRYALNISSNGSLDVTGPGTVVTIRSVSGSSSSYTVNIGNGVVYIYDPVANGQDIGCAYHLDHGILEFRASPGHDAVAAIHFQNGGNTLILDQGMGLNLLSVLKGFADGDTLVLRNAREATHAAWTQNAFLDVPIPGGKLTLYDNGNRIVGAAALAEGYYSASRFTINTTCPKNSDIPVPCFAAGTNILTTRGQIRVEELRIGDIAITSGKSGHSIRPVRWIGERHVDLTRHPCPELTMPIIIRKNAFGDGKPARDLYLSPDHALYINGVLIPASQLVNHTTIVRSEQPSVRYYHVKLDAHDILLAENLPVESYLDSEELHEFRQLRGAIVLYADIRPLNREHACAPLCLRGAPVEKTRGELWAEATRQGFHLDPLNRVTINASGRILEANKIVGRLHHFILPPGTEEVTILSDTSSWSAVSPASYDTRMVGAAITGVVLNGRMIPLHSPRLAKGFYEAEHHQGVTWRWTDGNAVLKLPYQTKSAVLELLIERTIPIWRPLITEEATPSPFQTHAPENSPILSHAV